MMELFKAAGIAESSSAVHTGNDIDRTRSVNPDNINATKSVIYFDVEVSLIIMRQIPKIRKP
jgi:hypothetical protein